MVWGKKRVFQHDVTNIDDTPRQLSTLYIWRQVTEDRPSFSWSGRPSAPRDFPEIFSSNDTSNIRRRAHLAISKIQTLRCSIADFKWEFWPTTSAMISKCSHEMLSNWNTTFYIGYLQFESCSKCALFCKSSVVARALSRCERLWKRKTELIVVWWDFYWTSMVSGCEKIRVGLNPLIHVW